MKFDTHVHVWQPGDGHGVLIRERIPELDGDFSFAEVRAVLDQAGVTRAIVVSAAQEERETNALLRMAAENSDLVAGVVGWLDLEASDVATKIAAFAEWPEWLGVRLPLTILEDRHWIARPDVAHAVGTLAEAGALVEVLAAPQHFDDVAAVLDALNEPIAIIDHAGSPDFKMPPDLAWKSGMHKLACRPGVLCKVSAFWVPGDPAPDVDRAMPFFGHLLETFGPQRLVAAANWPVSSLAGTYQEPWLRLQALAERAGLSDSDWRLIAGLNAEKLVADVIARRAGRTEGT